MAALTNNRQVLLNTSFDEAARRGDKATVERLFKFVPLDVRRGAVGKATGAAKSYLSSKMYELVVGDRRFTLPPVRPERNDFEAAPQAGMHETGETGSLTRFEQVVTIVILSAAIFFIRT